MMNLPILPTTVVGSYSMPGWLERLETEYLHGRISRRDLDEIHDTAAKAAIKDQELAGVDIITDGELRRDNLIDYFAERLPGTQIDRGSKNFYYDFYDSVVRGKIPTASLGLVDDFKFLASNTDRTPKYIIAHLDELVPAATRWENSGSISSIKPIASMRATSFGKSGFSIYDLQGRLIGRLSNGIGQEDPMLGKTRRVAQGIFLTDKRLR